MIFEHALELMKLGKRVKRKTWKDDHNGMWIRKWIMNEGVHQELLETDDIIADDWVEVVG